MSGATHAVVSRDMHYMFDILEHVLNAVPESHVSWPTTVFISRYYLYYWCCCYDFRMIIPLSSFYSSFFLFVRTGAVRVVCRGRAEL